MVKFLALSLLLVTFSACAQTATHVPYWNTNTQLIPWRLPLAPTIAALEYIDLDDDGDPDVLRGMVNDSIPLMWIDDDDDMEVGDVEGDTDSDCLLLDLNRDGHFAGPQDLSIDWNDEDGDGIADMQLVVRNGKAATRNFFDWEADYMYVMDFDKDKIMHYIDWNILNIQAWEKDGHSNFFTDYHGNSLFMKMHGSSYRIGDLRYNWENPFIFYDKDEDGLTEMAIRLVDTPLFRPKDNKDTTFHQVDKEIDILYSKKIDHVSFTFDLDNDNGPGNEFDFDISLNFRGPGFDYTDQKHSFSSLRGLPEANKFFYDSRWRKVDELYYPDQDNAWNLIFNRGQWSQCSFVFDEDDDCNRWERVEFYEPKDLFKIGKNKGGLDNNAQADAAGDRGEWDTDFSGKGQLYVGAFDGRIHLYGAEWGAWRIDQTAYSYQGFGGLYNRWRPERTQVEPKTFGTVKYTDTNNNGFIDLVEYDLDGDTLFEDRVSLLELGVDDRNEIIPTSQNNYEDFQALFSSVAENMWARANDAVSVAKKYKVDTSHYAFYMKPHSLHQKYDYGYWLNFYIYQDLRHVAKLKKDKSLLASIDRAYYSGKWKSLQ
ncbi:hypothetical protein DXT99_01535 [Pontibacter diazotrophicus]|uniref:VCBS repeat-containing protein n=1 Tax=Pontibacter diazotrophicus TaxID=1400979 RepID=A0A3D8LII1_9BACT|nr:hypothetical protein [Pontibacter diazotrophicus]RDV17215.1 hypothetical protein DXT99_01535 [Pontibacter diazotrophicus]